MTCGASVPEHTTAAGSSRQLTVTFSTWPSRQLGVSTRAPPFTVSYVIKDCWFHREFQNKQGRSFIPKCIHRTQLCTGCDLHETAAVSVGWMLLHHPGSARDPDNRHSFYSNNRKVSHYSVPHLMPPKVTDFKGAGPYTCTCVITNYRMGTSKLLLNQISSSSSKTQP